MITRNSDSGLSRRKFPIASGAAGFAGLIGYTENNIDGGGSGSDSESEDSPDNRSGGLSGTIDIAGSSTVSPLATTMAECFQTEYSEVNVNLQPIGSGSGFANYFCTGQTDLNGASHPIEDEEQDQCENNDVTSAELEVATDVLTVIVNNDNNSLGKGLAIEQLQTISSTESTSTTWSDINSEWSDEEIEIYGPTNASGTYDYLIGAIVGEEGPGHRQDYSTAEQDRTVIQGVEGSEYTTGYLSFAYYSKNTDAMRAVPVENDVGEFVESSLNTALSGEHSPFSRPLFTCPAREPFAEERVAEFARYWIENSISREIVADEVSYIPLDEDDQQEIPDTFNTATEEAN